MATQPQAQAASLWQRVRMTLEMIKFEHSVFALPFALTGAALAIFDGRSESVQLESLGIKLFWIVVAMVAARSAAMAFNRVIDAEIDARNPRTKMRHVPAGLISRGFAWTFTAIAAVIFVFAAAMLNPLCLKLSPIALVVVCGYSLTKRFTSFSHLVLGFALGIAPSAAWIAIRGDLDPRILWLTAAVTFWTAGFDIIYACQDYEFDRDTKGLHSIPKRFGISGALRISRLLHVAMIGCLLALFWSFGLGWLAMIGIVVAAALLIYEHSLVRADDLSRVDAAFFTVNGYLGIVFALFFAADLLLK